MDTNFNEQDSLRVINEMISTARGNLQRGAGKYFVLWGYVICITALLHFVLQLDGFDDVSMPINVLWMASYTVGFGTTFALAFINRKNILVQTYTDRIVCAIWVGFGCSAVFLNLFFGSALQWFTYPVILVLYSFALSVSAKAYRFNWMYISVAVSVICTCTYKFIPPLYYPIPMAIALFCGNIVPGHMLNYKAIKNA
ncbi:MAG: hypothetical protein RL662_1744 [Bacteroidota bacterium]|jgi:hypothetical protein